MIIMEDRCESVEWMHLIQGYGRVEGFMNTLMKFWVHKILGIF